MGSSPRDLTGALQRPRLPFRRLGGRGSADGMRDLWARYGIFLILAGLLVFLTIASSDFLTEANLLNLGRQVSVLALISLAMLVVIITGNVDLTVGALLGLVGAAMVKIDLAHGAVLALAGGAAVAVVVGGLNGLLSTRGRNLSVIVTLAMLTILQGVTLLVTDGQPLFGFSESLQYFGGSDVAGIPVPLLVAVAAAIAVYVFLAYTRVGRELYAVGGNSEAARLSGIPTVRRIKLAFFISASLSAVAGLVLIGRVASAQPTAGIGNELDAVGAVLIGGASLNGGAGTVPKTLAGVLILGLINNGINLLNVNPFVSYIVKGVVILVAILLDQWERRGR